MRINNRSRTKRILVDVLGYFLIVVSALTGWLPGPGGLPPLILGLSLLATNHEWAERILLYVKKHGVKIADKLFDGSPRVKMLIDIIGVCLVITGVLMVTLLTRSIAKTAAISLLAVSITLLLGNRKRFHHIKRHIKKQ